MKLQVFLNNKWEWVFCRNDRQIIPTKEKSKSLPSSALPYFQRHFAEHKFKIIK